LKDDLPGLPCIHTLRDGTTITIRYLGPDDRDGLRDAYRATSARTRYLRFMYVASDLSDEMLTYLTDVDQKDHVAIVATMTSPDMKSERGVGVARFIRMKGASDVAEVAITVSDDMQSKGVGKALARELERLARARGIRAFRADVLGSNATMRAILEHEGARRIASDDASVASYEIDLEPTEGPLQRFIRSWIRGVVA
jgi:GNAT superfamily N-acetyltransferase